MKCLRRPSFSLPRGFLRLLLDSISALGFAWRPLFHPGVRRLPRTARFRGPIRRELDARRQRRVAMGCAGSKIDADAWIQPQPEPTPRQADAVVKESPYLQLDIKREGAAFMGSNPPLAEIHQKPDGSTFLTAVRNHFLKSKQPSATTIFGADAAVAAVITGPEAPAEGGLSNHMSAIKTRTYGGDMSASRRAASCLLPRLSTRAQRPTRRWRLTARCCMRSPRSCRASLGATRPGWECTL